MSFKKLTIFSLCAFVAFDILVGCAGEESDLPDGRFDLTPGHDVAEEELSLELTKMSLDVLYYGVDMSNPEGFSCSQGVQEFTVLIEGLETSKPNIVGSNGVIRCNELVDGSVNWYVECKWFTPSIGFFPAYWTYFYFTLDKFRWEGREYLGSYEQLVDVGNGFIWCLRYFHITDAELVFLRR